MPETPAPHAAAVGRRLASGRKRTPEEFVNWCQLVSVLYGGECDAFESSKSLYPQAVTPIDVVPATSRLTANKAIRLPAPFGYRAERDGPAAQSRFATATSPLLAARFACRFATSGG
jgi:hypothetical protein